LLYNAPRWKLWRKVQMSSPILDAIQYALSTSPAVAGKRLRSERELAVLFSVGESKIRKYLSKLVQQGVLVRRRGCGTFIRRIATPPDNFKDLSPEMLKKASNIFSESRSSDISTKIQSVQLHIGLWGDLGTNSLIDQFILGSIAKSVSSRGHRLTVHNVIGDFETWSPISVDEFRKQLDEASCDGYLVVNSMAPLFNEAIEDKEVPVMFFLAGTSHIDNQPLVMFDTNEAITRAVRKFNEIGYKKIGLIGEKRESDNLSPPIPEPKAYDQAMEECGLDYRAYESSPLGVGQAIEATRKLLGRSDPPEAIYVSDDNVMVGVAEALNLEGVVPGKDIAIITLSNRNFPLPPGRVWSTMQFDRERFAQLLVDNLLYQLQSTGSGANTVALHANWIEGQTHSLERKQSRSGRKISEVSAPSGRPAKADISVTSEI
jgi:DNA-binding LacI/PurR family transcriptional regulator/DNA-binding transcriptional regulator YhcF (GntR family)